MLPIAKYAYIYVNAFVEPSIKESSVTNFNFFRILKMQAKFKNTDHFFFIRANLWDLLIKSINNTSEQFLMILQYI